MITPILIDSNNNKGDENNMRPKTTRTAKPPEEPDSQLSDAAARGWAEDLHLWPQHGNPTHDHCPAILRPGESAHA